MKTQPLQICSAGVLFLVAGLAPFVWGQQPGPSSPATAASVAAQNPPGPTSGAEPALSAFPSANSTSPTPARAAQIMVPTGTHLSLVLHNGISTHSAQAGDPVYFETLFPVLVDGHVVIPAGSYVSGEITESKRPGRVKGRAELMIKLTTMILPNAYVVSLNAAPGNASTGGGETVDKEGKIRGDTDKASDAGTVVKSTAAGAGIGAIAGRSGTGAGIGAGVGAAAGLAAVLLSRGPDAEMPRGTTLEAVLDRPIFLDADKVQFTSPGQASALSGPTNREPQRMKLPF
jgi:hypothetical protein